VLKLQGLVIDMDGTITKFNLDYVAARRRTLEELERLGLRTPEMNEQSSLFVLLNQLKETLEPAKFLALRSTFYHYFEEMELKAAEDVVLYPGAADTLRNLKSKPLKLGLVTNNSRTGTDLTLKRLKLHNTFDAVITRDDCEEMKPNGAPVVKILKEMMILPEAAIVVGDGALDILAAKEAGVRSVAVTTGPFPIERILRAEPDYIIASINDLPTLIERLDT
jgi:phosphoglycolate phosphatase